MTKFPARKSRKKPGKPKRIRNKGNTAKDQLIWGINPVMEALSVCPEAIREIFVDKDGKGKRLAGILEKSETEGIPVTDNVHLREIVSGTGPEFSRKESSQAIAARVTVELHSFDELLGKLKKLSSPPFLLALDSVQDPHNLGAIIRSAVGAGVDGVILPKDRSATVTGTVVKVSAGAVFHTDIYRVTNLSRSLKDLKEVGLWIYGTAVDSAKPLYEIDMTVPLCLVIGSEGKGLRPLVAEQCDQNISIPMQTPLDSLNASVAAGIILFETVRQRKI